MLEIKIVKVNHILNPTSIDLGEYVINPFLGCEYACLYCYVRQNRVISKKSDPWGSYVEVRVNAPSLLEKEILLKKPETVLLGSTTECFQPIEKKYKTTASILEILNRYGIFYYILTRSPEILEYTTLLKKGFCKKIYFTINNMPQRLKERLEKLSPPFEERIQAIEKLIKTGIEVVPYFSPLLPEVSNLEEPFITLNIAKRIEFEGLNFKATNINLIIKLISDVFPEANSVYQSLTTDKDYYDSYWQKLKTQIKNIAKKYKKESSIYIHSFDAYFNNTYTKTPQLATL